MNERRRKAARIVAAVMAVLMGVTVIAGALSAIVAAADQNILVDARTLTVDHITKDDLITMNFRVPYIPKDLVPNRTYSVDSYTLEDSQTNGNSRVFTNR